MPSPVLPKKTDAPPDHGDRIHEVLAKVFRHRKWQAVEERTPLSELLDDEDAAERARRDDEDERAEGQRRLVDEARAETMRRILDWIFADGPHLLDSAKRLYLLARYYRPQRIAWMQGTELAAFFGERGGRATQDARAKRVLNLLFERAGDPHAIAPGQRGSDTRAKCAGVQAGNANRRGGKKFLAKHALSH